MLSSFSLCAAVIGEREADARYHSVNRARAGDENPNAASSLLSQIQQQIQITFIELSFFCTQRFKEVCGVPYFSSLTITSLSFYKKKKRCAVTCAARLVVPGEILIEMLRTTLTVREQIFVLYAS